jgi:hypothetical protein
MRHSFVSYRLAATGTQNKRPLNPHMIRLSCLRTIERLFDRRTQKRFSQSNLLKGMREKDRFDFG